LLDHGVAELDPTLPLSSLLAEVIDPDRATGTHPVIERNIRKGARVYCVLALPLLEGTTVLGAATIIHDVTEEERSRKAQELLAATHERVGTSLGVMRTARELAAVAVEDFADVATVDLVDAVFHRDEAPLPPVRNSTAMRRAAFETVTEFTSLYEVGEPSRFVFPTPCTQALSDLRTRLVDPRGSPSDWHMNDAARAGILRQAGVHSMILAPLVQHGRILGLLGCARRWTWAASGPPSPRSPEWTSHQTNSWPTWTTSRTRCGRTPRRTRRQTGPTASTPSTTPSPGSARSPLLAGRHRWSPPRTARLVRWTSPWGPLSVSTLATRRCAPHWSRSRC